MVRERGTWTARMRGVEGEGETEGGTEGVTEEGEGEVEGAKQ
jgi:hypothetical protein